MNCAGQEVALLEKASSFASDVIGKYSHRLVSNLRSEGPHSCCYYWWNRYTRSKRRADLVAILMQLSDAGDNSDVHNKFLSRKNTIYEDESMASFECKICPALRNYHKAIVNAVAPFGEVVSFEKEYQRTSAYYAFKEPRRALFSTKVFYSTLTDLPLNASIPSLDPDAFINEHISMQFFSRIDHAEDWRNGYCSKACSTSSFGKQII